MSIKSCAFAALAAFALGSAAMAENIEMVIGDKTFAIELNGNDAAKALIARLPVKLQFEDYGSTERIAYLNPKLDTGSAPARTTPKTGDVTYYMPWGNLAVFVKPFRTSDGLVPLGHMSDEALTALRDCGSAEVMFRSVK